jgi:hypothetical protein
MSIILFQLCLERGKPVCFCVLKAFLKKFKIFFHIKIFLVFLNHFDALISKLIFFKKYYFNIFLSKKHNRNHTLKKATVKKKTALMLHPSQ